MTQVLGLVVVAAVGTWTKQVKRHTSPASRSPRSPGKRSVVGELVCAGAGGMVTARTEKEVPDALNITCP